MARWRASWRGGWARWPGRAAGTCQGPGRWPGPARRNGPAPLRELFARLAGPLSGPATPGAWAFGRLLAALDGTVLDVPYSPANMAAFGAPPAAAAAAGDFPQVRVVTLTACGTRAILDAAFRGRRAPRSSEQDLARKIAARGPVPGRDADPGRPELRRLPGRRRPRRHRRGPADPGQVQPVVTRAGGPAGRLGPLRAARPARPAQRTAVARYRRPARCPGPRRRCPVRRSSTPRSPSPRPAGQPRTERCRLITTLHELAGRTRRRPGRLLPPALGSRDRLPRPQDRHPRPRPHPALPVPGRRHPGNLGPALRLPAHRRRPRPRRRHRRPRPRPHLRHRDPARHPPRHHHHPPCPPPSPPKPSPPCSRPAAPAATPA